MIEEITVPINYQFSKAFVSLGQVEKNHHSQSKKVNPQIASDFLNMMKLEEIEPWSIPP